MASSVVASFAASFLSAHTSFPRRRESTRHGSPLLPPRCQTNSRHSEMLLAQIKGSNYNLKERGMMAEGDLTNQDPRASPCGFGASKSGNTRSLAVCQPRNRSRSTDGFNPPLARQTRRLKFKLRHYVTSQSGADVAAGSPRQRDFGGIKPPRRDQD